MFPFLVCPWLVIPWCPRKFSLRGLFVVMTVLATVVGVIVWVDKTF
ncbi:MAG: hypothetical protein ACR2FY_20525 [Pirellulaceae bacterium]